MDGLEATRRIRSLERQTSAKPCPIIALTANAMKGDREAYLSSGIDGYVAKPVEPASLYAEIERVVVFGQGLAPSPEPGTAQFSDFDEFLKAGTVDRQTDSFVDWIGAVRHSGSNEALLRDVLAAFLPELPQHLAELAQCVSDRDIEALQRSAHTLKGLSATFGMTAAADSAKQLESACRDHPGWPELEALTMQLVEQLENCRPALHTICNPGNQ